MNRKVRGKTDLPRVPITQNKPANRNQERKRENRKIGKKGNVERKVKGEKKKIKRISLTNRTVEPGS